MIEDDLDIYLNEFGELATLKGLPVRIIFDNDYAPMLTDFAEGRSIVACLKTSDFEAAGAEHFDFLAVRGVTYTVIGVQPAQDGRFTDLVLKE